MSKFKIFIFIILIFLLITNSIIIVNATDVKKEVNTSIEDEKSETLNETKKESIESDKNVSKEESKDNENNSNTVVDEKKDNSNSVKTENNEIKDDNTKSKNETKNTKNTEITNTNEASVDNSNVEVKEQEFISNDIKVNETAVKPGVTYRTHVQNLGWQGWKNNGQMAGTSGQFLRLEGINIKLENSSGINIRYKTHVQNIGWQDWKRNGEFSGTEGLAFRLEAIRIELENSDKYSVKYRVHVQNLGWQGWKYDGELAGTEGQSLRLEAIEIQIVDKVDGGKIYVESKIENEYLESVNSINVSGWSASNVKNCSLKVTLDNKDVAGVNRKSRNDIFNGLEKKFGTSNENPKPGFDFKIDLTKLSIGEHKLKIELITPNKKTLANYTKTFTRKRPPSISYSTHVQNLGWQNYTKDGQTSGTEGRAFRLEAIKINAENLPKGVSIKYQTHVQNMGWQEWKSNNQISGTEGLGLRLEAIKIKLEGTSEYSIQYRVHVQNIGWQPWCYDGESAGTEGLSYRLEAIQIRLVPKINSTSALLYIDNPNGNISNTVQDINGWVMSSVGGVSLKIFIDNSELDSRNIVRYKRQDVLNEIKGYGDENVYNSNNGYKMSVDFSKYSLGLHTVKVQAIANNNVLTEWSQVFNIQRTMVVEKGVYGSSGLKVKGDSRGSDLPYYRFGNGSNVCFVTFAVHGWEDNFTADGNSLVAIADEFFNRLVNSNDWNLHDKWTIYLFPGVNQDGLKYGYTHNGPGRTTLTSMVGKGIDLNRCWQVGNSYSIFSSDRNFNGSSGFQAYESVYLRDFLLNHKSATGQTVLVDCHGWLQQLIGDPGICSYYDRWFPGCNKTTVGKYGDGYLVNWARLALGNSNRACRTALIELPRNIYSHSQLLSTNTNGKFIQATIDMLNGIN